VLPTHATFVAHLLREHGVRRVIQIGVRGVLPMSPALPDRLLPVRVDELKAALLPDVPVYLTIDTDGFDPSIAPAVGYPSSAATRPHAESTMPARTRERRRVAPTNAGSWMALPAS
jgi:arginase family enzyme